MIITVPQLGYQLRPYGGGPCWHLFQRVAHRKDGESLPDSWRSCGVYPSSLESGLKMIRERAARRSKAARDLSAAIRELQAMDAALHVAVEAGFERSGDMVGR